MAADPQPQNKKVSVSFDYRIIIGVLLVIIVAMLIMWRPWEGNNDRTVEVIGEATVSAVPDEFVFYPVYDFKNADRNAALADLQRKSAEITSKLKELGVADSKIKTNSDGYDYPVYKEDGGVPTYSLRFTITLENKDLAQKVQDYLVTTTPTGGVSPQANFSDKKRRDLEREARDKATQDARSKAEQSARNLGFSLGQVKSVNDGAGFGGIALPARGSLEASDSTASQLNLQPGENDLSYTVTVVYFLR